MSFHVLTPAESSVILVAQQYADYPTQAQAAWLTSHKKTNGDLCKSVCDEGQTRVRGHNDKTVDGAVGGNADHRRDELAHKSVLSWGTECVEARQEELEIEGFARAALVNNGLGTGNGVLRVGQSERVELRPRDTVFETSLSETSIGSIATEGRDIDPLLPDKVKYLTSGDVPEFARRRQTRRSEGMGRDVSGIELAFDGKRSRTGLREKQIHKLLRVFNVGAVVDANNQD
ncbi:hypothetical protein OE88DRAFT_1648849 [Heliocybe sulcata]|uniref:Uncharacterized protein n=1 Tax=Heliocybe sulcata TaxID=5364 RepID=A0A5C3MN20_9AGAM|nr:hypothetical protein OE88DRAFT_1648849 [Heliocybe sulcata]